jgi:hypothetical protein
VRPSTENGIIGSWESGIAQYLSPEASCRTRIIGSVKFSSGKLNIHVSCGGVTQQLQHHARAGLVPGNMLKFLQRSQRKQRTRLSACFFDVRQKNPFVCSLIIYSDVKKASTDFSGPALDESKPLDVHGQILNRTMGTACDKKATLCVAHASVAAGRSQAATPHAVHSKRS